MIQKNQLEINKKIYRRYIDILNAQDFDALPEVTDTQKYREICVGFTPGKVNLTNAMLSFKKVLHGIPNLHASIDDCIAEDNKVYARLHVRGIQSGNLFGMPSTNKSFRIHMFDYITIENGKIIDRVQQSDTLGEFITLFKGRCIAIGIMVLLLIIGLIIAVILK